MQPKAFIKILAIIHASLCIGLAIFVGFAYVLNGNFSAYSNSNDVLVYIVPFLAIAGYFASKYSYQNLIKKLAQSEPLATKLKKYKIASIIQYVLLEGPAFLALLAYYISGTAIHLVIAISLMLHLFFQRPFLRKLESEIPLNKEEQQQFK